MARPQGHLSTTLPDPRSGKLLCVPCGRTACAMSHETTFPVAASTPKPVNGRGICGVAGNSTTMVGAQWRGSIATLGKLRSRAVQAVAIGELDDRSWSARSARHRRHSRSWRATQGTGSAAGRASIKQNMHREVADEAGVAEDNLCYPRTANRGRAGSVIARPAGREGGVDVDKRAPHRWPSNAMGTGRGAGRQARWSFSILSWTWLSSAFGRLSPVACSQPAIIEVGLARSSCPPGGIGAAAAASVDPRVRR